MDGERGFDHGGGEARSYVPLNVAVEEPDTGVVGAEAQDKVAVWVDEDGVASHWRGRGRRGVGGVVWARV